MINSPGVPDYLTLQQSNKVKLAPIQPLYLSRATKSMNGALAKVEEEEKIPPIRLQKPQPLGKKQKQLQNKRVAKLMKHAAQGERQMMKAKLADKKKAIKEESEKVCRMKKRAKIDDNLEKVWEKVDEQLSNKMKTREQTLQENDAAIEKHSVMIQRPKREIELLKGKQECKVMRHELVRNKGYKSILSDTVRQCEATKLRRRYFGLGREIDKLWDEVNSRQHKVQELIPNSSCSITVINTESDVQAVHQGDSNTTPPSKVVLVRSSGSEDENAYAGVSVPQLSEETESAFEEDPFARYGFAPPVHERKPANTALIALFIGESARKQNENDCLRNFQESCKKPDAISTRTVVEESAADSTSINSYSIDSSLESQSSYSFEFEESSETEEVASEPSPTPDPPLFRNTSMVSPYLLLPARLYTIEEETEQDLEDYENDVYESPRSQLFNYCSESDTDNIV